jgi:hypothetical protein
MGFGWASNTLALLMCFPYLKRIPSTVTDGMLLVEKIPTLNLYVIRALFILTTSEVKHLHAKFQFLSFYLDGLRPIFDIFSRKISGFSLENFKTFQF